MAKMTNRTIGPVSIQVIDYSKETFNETMRKIEVALEAIGGEAVGKAQAYLEASPRRVDTGRLRNSITFTTSYKQGFTYNYSDDNGQKFSQNVAKGEAVRTVFIGTDVNYAKYVHWGTYKMDPNPFLKNAVQNHQQRYIDIAKKYLK